MRRFARHYGASPLQLMAHVIVFALAGWAIAQLIDIRGAWDVLKWFVAALILHDLVLLPAYSSLDLYAQRLRLRGIPLTNYVRVPAILSALSFLVFFPLIARTSAGYIHYISNVTTSGYLSRWLLMVAGFWLVSAALLAVRLVRADQLQHPARPAGDGDGAGR